LRQKIKIEKLKLLTLELRLRGKTFAETSKKNSRRISSLPLL